MKRYFLIPVLALFAIAANAQDFDTNPTLKVDNNDAHFTIGARMMTDAAYYHSDFTPLQSGASITDARIRTSMTYKDWYFYADFGFGGGKFAQKNIFLQYSKEDASGNNHAIKVGYYNDPAGSMARLTSLGSYHFISRPGSSNALGEGRELGITYKFTNKNFTAYQGVFTENQYNKIDAGFNGLTVSGRWLYRPIKDDNQTLHVGVNARFSHLGGGVAYNNTLKKTLSLGQALETYVDEDNQFVSCDLDWANNVFDLGAEALYHNDKMFIRGEFMYKSVTKKRDSETLFEASNTNIDTWGSLAWWEAANPIRTNKFYGGYAEAGFLVFGNPYHYDLKEGVLSGLNGKALEIVARFNYTGLNDINKGEYFSAGRNQYYPNGYMEDWPYASSSVGGGKICSYTIGVNYSFNKYVLAMLDYTYSSLKKDLLPYDKNFHAVQARVQFTF
ncbi:MAG: OprO/OprP family phosphate-selective porin [Muribaculaceae bacterium]|jgi:phosphate-selective porin OprO and OprP|nr:OprO/OprP family phosphate-selective porin [Muribaculaceae bacterium]